MFPPPFRLTRRLRLATGVAVLFVLLAAPTHAELVEHTFTGILVDVTDGTSGYLDLTGTFSKGQTLTLVLVVDRSAPGQFFENVRATYTDAVPSWSLAIGAYGRPAGPPISPNLIYVSNDLTKPLSPLRGATNPQAGTLVDQFYVEIPTSGLPAVGSATAMLLHLDLLDDDGTAWSDLQLPRSIPDLAQFEIAQCSIGFASDTGAGRILATIGEATTPVRATTWGRLKSNYRD